MKRALEIGSPGWVRFHPGFRYRSGFTTPPDGRATRNSQTEPIGPEGPEARHLVDRYGI